MSIKFNTPKPTTTAIIQNTEANDAIVTSFVIDRIFEYIAPGRVIISDYSIRTNWSLANKAAPGEFILLGTDTVTATGNQARNFLNQNVNGKLGIVTEEAILAALVALGRIPAGIIEEE